jgi:hypothetical protein
LPGACVVLVPVRDVEVGPTTIEGCPGCSWRWSSFPSQVASVGLSLAVAGYWFPCSLCRPQDWRKGREKSLCYCWMTVTPAGAITFLEASARPFHHASSGAMGETVHPVLWCRQRRRYGGIPFLEALSGLLLESYVGYRSQGRSLL